MKKLLFISPIILALLLACSSSSTSTGIEEAVGVDAPSFTYTSLSNTQVSLSDYSGKVVYLFFYGANCPHCISNGPITESQIYQTFKDDENFVALGLDTWNLSASANTSFQNSTGISYTLLLNARQSLVDYYGNAGSYDRSVVISADGKIAYKGSGFVNSDVNTVVSTIEQELQKINS